MFLWRISNQSSLDGIGGLRASARWHTLGRPVVYLATSAAGALVEHLVHLELPPGLIPDHFNLMKVEVPEELAIETVERARLTAEWADRLEVTRAIGDEWLQAGRTALLLAPSVIVPETFNALLNPRHADARRVQRLWQKRFPLDGRLLKPTFPR